MVATQSLRAAVSHPVVPLTNLPLPIPCAPPPPLPRPRFLDDLLIQLKLGVGEASAEACSLIYDALPKLGSGYRLNEALELAANRWGGVGWGGGGLQAE